MAHSVLVVAAHPDDEVLGCGGTIARLADEGHAVHILILGEGVTSRYGDPAQAKQSDLQALHKQAEAVAASLGACGVSLAKLPDNRFDTVALLDIVKVIEEQVERCKPAVVYTQHGGDLNIDHALTFRATLTATRPMAGSSVERVFAYEVRSSTEWAFRQFAPAFAPTTFVDISTTLERKLRAMEMYEGESRAFPHPRSGRALKATAEYWGSVSGLQAAEAFQLVREFVR